MEYIEDSAENLLLAESVTQVDALNSEFYGKFPYPWPPTRYIYWEDRSLQTKLLNQDIGDYTHSRLQGRPRIWVAGCGTNQAIFTALRFPDAQIVGSDVSEGSLTACARMKESFGIENLELRQESLNNIKYREQFDYVLCTGVIHHNFDPGETLGKLRNAMKPSGIMELMVYNRYHRMVCTAVQKAIRLLLAPEAPELNCDNDLRIATKLLQGYNLDNMTARLLEDLHGQPESHVVDTIIQPVERSYTIATLGKLISDRGLDFLLPTVCQFDQVQNTFDWYVNFNDEELRTRFEGLSDVMRWHVANLLLMEKSPQLWFYLKRADSALARCSEEQANANFLDCRFKRVDSGQGEYRRESAEGYKKIANRLVTSRPPAPFEGLYSGSDGKLTMRQLFAKENLPTSHALVRQARIRLTTTAFPYLVAC